MTPGFSKFTAHDLGSTDYDTILELDQNTSTFETSTRSLNLGIATRSSVNLLFEFDDLQVGSQNRAHELISPLNSQC